MANNDHPFFPVELIVMILSWLPATALLRFKCVSRSWYELINSPHFIKLHLTNSIQRNSYGTLILHHEDCSLHTLDFHGSRCHTTKLLLPKNNLHRHSKLVGSCNGLLCFKLNYDHTRLTLYNPTTRAFKRIPQFTTKKEDLLYSQVGFGYDCISNDYKILRIARLVECSEKWGTILYSLRTNAWEIIANPTWVWDSLEFPGVVLNNSLHWVNCDDKDIKCMDLFTQRCFHMPLPNKTSADYEPTLAVLRGQLALVNCYFDLWIMEYGVQESWTRLFRCPHMQWNCIFESATFCLAGNKGFCLVWSDNECKTLVVLGTEGKLQNFVSCDLESREAKLEKTGLQQCGHYLALLPWVESLAPL